MVFILIFISALISATLFPFGSEALLVFYINEGHNLTLLLLFASVGNVLGSVINYFLGLKGEEFLEKKAILKKEMIKRAKVTFDKFGSFALLFAWVPIIGDPITFIAGVLRYDFKLFLLFVTISKTLRYIFLALLTLNFI